MDISLEDFPSFGPLGDTIFALMLILCGVMIFSFTPPYFGYIVGGSFIIVGIFYIVKDLILSKRYGGFNNFHFPGRKRN